MGRTSLARFAYLVFRYDQRRGLDGFVPTGQHASLRVVTRVGVASSAGAHGHAFARAASGLSLSFNASAGRVGGFEPTTGPGSTPANLAS